MDFDHTGFEWIDCSDFEGSVVSFIRRAHDPSDFVVVAVNFTPVPRHDYIIGVPEAGRVRRAAEQRRRDVRRQQSRQRRRHSVEPDPAHGRPHRLSLILPPLGMPDPEKIEIGARGKG